MAIPVRFIRLLLFLFVLDVTVITFGWDFSKNSNISMVEADVSLDFGWYTIPAPIADRCDSSWTDSVSTYSLGIEVMMFDFGIIWAFL